MAFDEVFFVAFFIHGVKKIVAFILRDLSPPHLISLNRSLIYLAFCIAWGGLFYFGKGINFKYENWFFLGSTSG